MNTRQSTKFIILQFAVVIFISAFLLFQVQPLIGKYILPWFGGTSAVWTTCMLFFQIVLFVGYLYAHLLTRFFSPRTQGLVHLGLLVIAAVLMPITPEVDWKPTGEEAPIPRIIILLSMSVGVPFFALSATGPLLQRWFSLRLPSASPYRLYALSNAGSLLALISYPFVFAPQLSATRQTSLWSIAFWVFAALCGLCALTMFGTKNADSKDPQIPTIPDVPPSFGKMAFWFGLSMSASVMLLAVTNQVCLDVASVPFLWVMPLTLYLLTFIICFDNERWYFRSVFLLGMLASIGGICFILRNGVTQSIFVQVMVYFLGLFFCCMVCHGELVKLKPSTKYLTLFYLVISAGGASGGLFVGLAAPLLFSSYIELHIGLLACCLLAMVVLLEDPQWFMNQGKAKLLWLPIAVVFALLVMFLKLDVYQDAREISRSFYGVLRVIESNSDEPENHKMNLMHGSTLHGTQFMSEDKNLLPTTYYGTESAVGQVLIHHHAGEPRKIGIVGLGVGTLASYGKQGDQLRIYEINADVVRLAKKHFSFLSSCEANVSVVMGDARLSMEREIKQKGSQQFDVLVLDAFSSDAIPTHLLTKEAGEIYLQHLRDDGILAIHISNRHLELRPVVRGLAGHFELEFSDHSSESNQDKGTTIADWMLVSRMKSSLEIPSLKANSPEAENVLLWTDEDSNLFETLKNEGVLKFGSSD
ncbi:MAG: hypothetical protein COA78_09225 [Blastopirellula sp.]|nr:MAG: hypothetical protein COA78_09225 [Blastopirellula sp.]